VGVVGIGIQGTEYKTVEFRQFPVTLKMWLRARMTIKSGVTPWKRVSLASFIKQEFEPPRDSREKCGEDWGSQPHGCDTCSPKGFLNDSCCHRP